MAEKKLTGAAANSKRRRDARLATVPTAELLRMLPFAEGRESLLAFTVATMPGYEAGWFHREVAAELDRFLADVAEKKGPRLILTAPPQHGKSELASRRLPAYALGRNPGLRVIATAYSADLAESFSLAVQRIMDSPEYGLIFPAVKLASDFAKGAQTAIRRADVFEVVGHAGRYRAAGVGGGITGQAADILIVDDPIKDFAQAHSRAYRQGVWDWFRSTAYSRLSSGAGVIVMLTRWHEDDLVGRLMAAQDAGGDRWRIINFPAIAEGDEPHRRAGDPLSVERFTLADLEQRRANLGEYQWAALYQQRPAPASGGIWKREWWRFWDRAPEKFDEVLQSWDMAFKATDRSDFVCGGVWGRKGADKYLLDAAHARLSFSETLAAVRRLSAKWPQARLKLVEDKANGPAVIDALNHEVGGFVAVQPEGGKEARAHAVSAEIEAGNVYLPDPARTPWVPGLVEESASFPSAPHDDWVDMVSQALNRMRNRGTGGLFEYVRTQVAAAEQAVPAGHVGAGERCRCGASGKYVGEAPVGTLRYTCFCCGAAWEAKRDGGQGLTA